jgi:hypothetical protein
LYFSVIINVIARISGDFEHYAAKTMSEAHNGAGIDRYRCTYPYHKKKHTVADKLLEFNSTFNHPRDFLVAGI